MQKERSTKPFFLACLYAALTSLAIGIGILLLLCALCLVTDDPASTAGYGANIALLLTAFLAGLLSAKGSHTQTDSAVAPILRGLTAGAIVLCLLLGLSMLVPSTHSGRLTHLLSTLPIYALCVLGLSVIGGLSCVNRRPKKRSARAPKHLRSPKGAHRKY